MWVCHRIALHMEIVQEGCEREFDMDLSYYCRTPISRIYEALKIMVSINIDSPFVRCLIKGNIQRDTVSLSWIYPMLAHTAYVGTVMSLCNKISVRNPQERYEYSRCQAASEHYEYRPLCTENFERKISLIKLLNLYHLIWHLWIYEFLRVTWSCRCGLRVMVVFTLYLMWDIKLNA